MVLIIRESKRLMEKILYMILQLNWIATSVSNESIVDRNELLKAYNRGQLVVKRDRTPQLENVMCGGRV